jgi:predicted lipoprotein with Yx(FWY)xxD motif
MHTGGDKKRMYSPKKLGIPLVLLLIVIMGISFMAASADEESYARTEDEVVADLGILVGDGSNLSNVYLNKPTTRMQAAILFLRLKGLESEAKAFKGTANFVDAKLVWSQGQSILAYLKAKPSLGWLGVGHNTFDPLAAITSTQFYKVMLETLEFKQGVDYEYKDVLQFSAQHGLTRVANVQSFQNVNAATAIIEALKAQVHNTGKSLAVKLAESKIIDPNKIKVFSYTYLELKLNDALGVYLADNKGMTLYYTTKNASDLNSCTASCLTNWPVFFADKLLIPAGLEPKEFAVYIRKDGIKQTTFRGFPLYYNKQDRNIGDILGQGVDKAWYVINPFNFRDTIGPQPTATPSPTRSPTPTPKPTPTPTPKPTPKPTASPTKSPSPTPGSKTLQVKDFGAAGNGVKDDTAAIQAAVNKAGDMGGARVFFPKGVYLTKDEIVIRKDNITLEGVGWEAELRITEHPKRVITIENAKNSIVRNLQISLGVSGVQRNDMDEGIYVTGNSSNFMIEKILGNGKGVMTRGNVNHGVIRDNSFKNTLADGIHITNGSKNIEIINNTLENTGDDAIAVVSYAANNGKLAENIRIIGNRVKNSKSRGIVHIGGKEVDILSNVMDGTSSSGILIGQDHNYNTLASYNTHISDNTVIGAGTYAVKKGNEFGIEVASGAFDTTIINNLIQDGVNRGIGISSPKTLIQFNRVLRNKESGIQIDADQVTVEGNQLEGNGKYGVYSDGSKGLIILTNTLINNNEQNGSGIDNLMLIDGDDAKVKDNKSNDTRVPALVERPYQILGSCKNLIYEGNSSSGTKQGELVQCTK